MSATTFNELREKYKVNGNNRILKTNLLPLDIILGGGLKEGSIYEIHSPSGVGKSTIAIQICKNLIKAYDDYNVFYIDADAASYELVNRHGIDKQPDRFIYSNINKYEELDELTDTIISNDDLNIKLLVIDTITMVTSENYQTKPITNIYTDLEESKYSTRYLKKYKNLFNAKGITVILLNQERVDISGVQVEFCQKVFRAAGAKIIKYAPDTIIRLNEGDAISVNKNIMGNYQEVKIGHKLKITAKKNKRAIPNVTIETPFMFGNGILNHMFMANILTDHKHVIVGRKSENKEGSETPYKTSILGEDQAFMGKKSFNDWVKDKYDDLYKILNDDGKLQLIPTKNKEISKE